MHFQRIQMAGVPAAPYWTAVNTFDFSNGTDAAQYTTALLGLTGRVSVEGDYSEQPHCWLTGGRKGIRFPKSTEEGGAGNSHYRAILNFDRSNYMNFNSITECRVTCKIWMPTDCQLGYRGQGGADADRWPILQVDDSGITKMLGVGFEGNDHTLGVWSTAGGTLQVAAAATQDVTGSIANGAWHDLDIQFKLHASTGYIKAQWDATTQISVTGLNTSMASGCRMFLYSGGSFQHVDNDLGKFSALADVHIYKH